MEAERQSRRLRTKEARKNREEEEKRNIAIGNPGDVDFIGLVNQWRLDHAGMARSHDYNTNDDKTRGGGESKICVCVRKRGLNTKEVLKMEHDSVTIYHPTATVHSARLRVDGISKYCDHNTFVFDHAFDELASTEAVYLHVAKPLVNYVVYGGRGGGGGIVPRGTVFAYGQTGSGKTYTMSGIQKMVAEDIFSLMSDNDDNNTMTCSIAMFEIYGGQIQDLLHERKKLKVLEDGKGEVVVSGLQEFALHCEQDFLSLIEKGHANRTTHATEANDVSSRSHAICQILFRDRNSGKLKGKLSLVDLAGSERGTDTKSHDKQRRTESSDINTSLLALKECIRAIDSESMHVPYRQSKLTLILKDCFVSRSARTAMIATLAPGSKSSDHTLNTLRYADRIKEKKVGDSFAPTLNNKSPPIPMMQPQPMKKLSPSQNDVDEYDELEEIMNDYPSSSQEVDEMDEEQVSEIDRLTVLFEEEENLLNLHMQSIHENAELLTEEGALLQSVSQGGGGGEDCNFDLYASRLGDILDRKTEVLVELRDRLELYRDLLKKEEELSGLQ
jgi:kinesin family protein 2/24